MMNFMTNGVVPNQQPVPKTGNWLPSDKYALLQKGLSQFKLSVTEEELAKGQCNHYNPNGTCALIQDPDGSGALRCSICGTKFNTAEFTKQDVENATQNILDILNTIKIMYLSLDSQAALEYFQIIPFIEKIPALYDIAVADFKKYEGIGSFTPTSSMNPFGMFNAMMSGMPMNNMMNPQMYQQPMGGMPMNNGMMPQQPPMAQPMYQQPMGNPMFQQPAAYNPQPQATSYAFNPMGAAAPQAPAQPMVNTNMPVQPQAAPTPAPAEPVATAPVTVDAQFKK